MDPDHPGGRRNRVRDAEAVRLDGLDLKAGAASPEQRILAAVRAIPPGEVAAYGEVARRAGLPGRARLAARVLSGNTDPGLPWHRVLRADGRIAFPAGSKGHREQARRLKAEGVRVEKGRVRIAATSGFDMDAEVWAPRAHGER